MSAWAVVLDDVTARGGTLAQVATRLGLPIPLVQAVLDHAERLGVLAVAGPRLRVGVPDRTGAAPDLCRLPALLVLIALP